MCTSQWGLGLSFAGDEDLFKEMEAEIKVEKTVVKPKKKPKPSFFRKWIKNSENKFSVRSMHHYKKPTDREGLDRRNHYAETKLQFKSNAKFRDTTFYGFVWGEYGNQKDTYQGGTLFMADRKRYRHFWELSEAYAVHGLESVDFTAGKKVFKMGTSTVLYSPSDRITPKDLNDPIYPRELGLWLSSLDYYVDASTFTLALFPYFIPSKSSASSSRWSGTGDSDSSGDNQFRDVNSVVGKLNVQEEFPGFAFKNFQGVLRFKTTVLGWDFFVASFHGFNALPVLKKYEERDPILGIVTKTTYTKQYVPVGNHSFGFSTTFGKFEFHGEGLYQYAYAGKDDHYFDYDGGITYTIDDWAKAFFLDQIDWTVDYAGEETTRYQDYPNYAQSSKDARAAKNNLISRVVLKYDEDLRFFYAQNLDFDEGGKMFAGGLEYKLTAGLILKLHTEFFKGTSRSYYGQWRENSRFVSNLEYSF